MPALLGGYLQALVAEAVDPEVLDPHVIFLFFVALCLVFPVFLNPVRMHLAHMMQERSKWPFVLSPWAAPGDNSADVPTLVEWCQGKSAKLRLVSNIMVSSCPVQQVAQEVHHLQCRHLWKGQSVYVGTQSGTRPCFA